MHGQLTYQLLTATNGNLRLLIHAGIGISRIPSGLYYLTRSLQVFKVKYTLPFPDPFMPQPRHHTVLFLPIPTHPSRSGTIHHVIGDLVSGMTYASRSEDSPESIEAFHLRELLGYVLEEDYLGRFEDLLRGLEAPPKQRAFRVETMRIEQIKGDGSWYEEGEEKSRMWKCTEWVEERVVPALKREGILKHMVKNEPNNNSP